MCAGETLSLQPLAGCQHPAHYRKSWQRSGCLKHRTGGRPSVTLLPGPGLLLPSGRAERKIFRGESMLIRGRFIITEGSRLEVSLRLFSPIFIFYR